MLWTVRVKGLGAVEEVLVEASDENRARLVADLWALKQGKRVVGLKKALVATEAELSAEAPKAEVSSAKPIGK